MTVVVAVVVGAGVTSCGGTPEVEVTFVDAGEIRSVTDGDTVRLTDGRRVRLVQIDAPEQGECFAREAGAALADRTPPGSSVVIEPDPLLDDRDGYRRFLRYVGVGDLGASVNVNIELVRLGAAVPYFFHGERGVYADELLDAVREARRKRRGLWGACPGAKLDPNRGALTGPA